MAPLACLVCLDDASRDGLFRVCKCRTARVHASCFVDMVAKVPAHSRACPVCKHPYVCRPTCEVGDAASLSGGRWGYALLPVFLFVLGVSAAMRTTLQVLMVTSMATATYTLCSALRCRRVVCAASVQHHFLQPLPSPRRLLPQTAEGAPHEDEKVPIALESV